MTAQKAEDARLIHPWIDRTHSPVYIMRFPSGTSDQELAALCETRERWARHASHPCAWVADLSQVRMMPPTQRKLFADHLKRFEAHDVAFNCGSAIVVTNAVIKGLLTAVFWLAPPKFPNQAFDDFDKALAWAKAQLAKSGEQPLTDRPPKL